MTRDEFRAAIKAAFHDYEAENGRIKSEIAQYVQCENIAREHDPVLAHKIQRVRVELEELVHYLLQRGEQL